LGIARFQRLRLGHVIGRERVTDDYLIRLYAGIGQCTEVLHTIRPHFRRPRSRLETLRRCWQLVRGPQFQRRLIWHRWKAERAAREQIRAALRDATAPQQ
jgi:hypothetical protein